MTTKALSATASAKSKKTRMTMHRHVDNAAGEVAADGVNAVAAMVNVPKRTMTGIVATEIVASVTAKIEIVASVMKANAIVADEDHEAARIRTIKTKLANPDDAP
jgi:hypothetical protein